MTTYNTGELLKQLNAEIKQAAKDAGVARGDLNNALLQAAPTTLEAVNTLLLQAKQLATAYKQQQETKTARSKSPRELIIAALTTGTKAEPSKLQKIATQSGVNKVTLNAALMHYIWKQKDPSLEASEAALSDPQGLIDVFHAHKSLLPLGGK